MNTSGFAQFYDSWFAYLHHLVHQLSSTARPPLTVDKNHNLLRLINEVVSHYEDYFRIKSLAAENDPLHVLVAPWATTLERTLHWITGWRPTTAFHLVYSESSVLFESHIIDILRGVRNGDLGDLSPTQFRRVSELQCDTVIPFLLFLPSFFAIKIHLYYEQNEGEGGECNNGGAIRVARQRERAAG